MNHSYVFATVCHWLITPCPRALTVWRNQGYYDGCPVRDMRIDVLRSGRSFSHPQWTHMLLADITATRRNDAFRLSPELFQELIS